ncbi:unnamed protein product [Rodentolepis nana]|uniref:Tub domain-containing protein n=1 Tax=Rodentolepis nana TaxID=102285 RepID=A0A0R3TD48_RODNA|nr:unnamed protein product [Rodentolepis nana]
MRVVNGFSLLCPLWAPDLEARVSSQAPTLSYLSSLGRVRKMCLVKYMLSGLPPSGSTLLKVPSDKNADLRHKYTFSYQFDPVVGHNLLTLTNPTPPNRSNSGTMPPPRID